MPQVFETHFEHRDFSAENMSVMREAYLSATRTLGLTDGSHEEDRLALIEIIQQLANLEPFRNAEHMAALAVEWYRSRR